MEQQEMPAYNINKIIPFLQIIRGRNIFKKKPIHLFMRYMKKGLNRFSVCS